MGGICAKSTPVRDAESVVPAASSTTTGKATTTAPPIARHISPVSDSTPRVLPLTPLSAAPNLPPSDSHTLAAPPSNAGAGSDSPQSGRGRPLQQRKLSASGLDIPQLQAKKVSRPSTPISRQSSASASQNTAGTPQPATAASGGGHLAWPSNPDVANDSLTPLHASSASSAMLSLSPPTKHASRRPSLLIPVPETIQEKSGGIGGILSPTNGEREESRSKKENATARAKSPELATTAILSHSRSTSRVHLERRGTLERQVTIAKIDPLKPSEVQQQLKQREEEDAEAGENQPPNLNKKPSHDRSISAASPTLPPLTSSHTTATHARRLSYKESGARYELTDAQEKELNTKPYLWCDPHIWKLHASAMFTFYTRQGSDSEAAISPSSVTFHPDRLSYSSLQSLASDCIHRMYLLLKKDLKKKDPSLGLLKDEELHALIWKKLSLLLPGGGVESDTKLYCSLYLLKQLCMNHVRYVTRREFLILFPTVWQELFDLPSNMNSNTTGTAAAADSVSSERRKKTMRACEKLTLEKLLARKVKSDDTEEKSVVSSTSTSSRALSPTSSHPIRLVQLGDRRATMNHLAPLPPTSPKQQQLPPHSGRSSQQHKLNRRSSLESGVGGGLPPTSPTNSGLQQSSVERFLADFSNDTSRRGSKKNMGTVTTLEKDRGAGKNEERKETFA